MTTRPPEPIIEPALAQRFVIDSAGPGIRWEAAAHRAAGLDGFEALVVLDAAADVVDDLAQGDAQRHFDQTGMLHIAGEGEGLGAFALFGAHAGEPFRAAQDDLRDVGIGFNVVVVGRLAPQTGDGREGRAGTRFAALAFDRGDQGGFFTAHERAGAQADFQVKGETAAKDILAQASRTRAPVGWRCSGS